jgi:hypothetical protein
MGLSTAAHLAGWDGEVDASLVGLLLLGRLDILGVWRPVGGGGVEGCVRGREGVGMVTRVEARCELMYKVVT